MENCFDALVLSAYAERTIKDVMQHKAEEERLVLTCVLASEEDTPPELAEALGSTLVSSRTAFARLFVLAGGAAAGVASFAISSGVAAGAYDVLKTWVEAKNNRKLKIKVGEIEVDATQMKEEEVLRIFEMLEEKADQKKIREALLEAGKGSGRPEAH